MGSGHEHEKRKRKEEKTEGRKEEKFPYCGVLNLPLPVSVCVPFSSWTELGQVLHAFLPLLLDLSSMCLYRH